MTRNEALQIAQANRTQHLNAQSAAWRNDLPGLTAAQEAEYGYRHGWYKVGDFNFNTEDLTGVAYDITQGG